MEQNSKCGCSAEELTLTRSVQATEAFAEAIRTLTVAIRDSRRERCPEGCLSACWLSFMTGIVAQPPPERVGVYRRKMKGDGAGRCDVATQTFPVTHDQLLRKVKLAAMHIAIRQAKHRCTCGIVEAILATMELELTGQNASLEIVEVEEEKLVQIFKCRGQEPNFPSEIVEEEASRNSSANHVFRPAWTIFGRKLLRCLSIVAAEVFKIYTGR